MHRSTGQGGFADALVKTRGRTSRLEQIAELIDWGCVDRLVEPIYAKPEGRPSYPPLVMVRAVLLAQWYGLSDPGLAEALEDRLSFRKFVGLGLHDETPDDATIWRFRDELSQRGLDSLLFVEVNSQLESQGMILKRGTLLDATLVRSQAAIPRNEKGQGKSRSQVDPDATWTRNRTGPFFGYKAHIAVDQDSNLIRRARLTPAHINESLEADQLICGDERAVYADKAYENKHRRARLRAARVKDRIMHRSHKNQPSLPRWQQRRNRLIVPIRRKVEHVFGTLKRSYGWFRMRYFSMRANATHLYLAAVAYNLRRALNLAWR
jgi:IS5 family transposase